MTGPVNSGIYVMAAAIDKSEGYIKDLCEMPALTLYDLFKGGLDRFMYPKTST